MLRTGAAGHTGACQTRRSNSVSSRFKASSHVSPAASTTRPYFQTAPCESDSDRAIARVVSPLVYNWIICLSVAIEILGVVIGDSCVGEQAPILTIQT